MWQYLLVRVADLIGCIIIILIFKWVAALLRRNRQKLDLIEANKPAQVEEMASAPSIAKKTIWGIAVRVIGIGSALLVFCALCVICVVAYAIQHPRNGHDDVDASVPNSFSGDISRAVRETELAIHSKSERDEASERKEARDVDDAERLAAIEKEKTGYWTTLKETKYAEWKTARKASMRFAASHLRPDQIAAWNKTMADWNRLTPAQQEALFRKEYQRTPEAAILDR